MLDKIWRFNRITGSWVFVRDCSPDNTQAWLEIFKGDEPDERFVVSARRPRTI